MPTAQIDNADDEVKQTLARGNSLRFAADVPRCHRVVGARDSQRHSPDETVSDPIEDAALQGWIVQVICRPRCQGGGQLACPRCALLR